MKTVSTRHGFKTLYAFRSCQCQLLTSRWALTAVRLDVTVTGFTSVPLLTLGTLELALCAANTLLKALTRVVPAASASTAAAPKVQHAVATCTRHVRTLSSELPGGQIVAGQGNGSAHGGVGDACRVASGRGGRAGDGGGDCCIGGYDREPHANGGERQDFEDSTSTGLLDLKAKHMVEESVASAALRRRHSTQNAQFRGAAAGKNTVAMQFMSLQHQAYQRADECLFSLQMLLAGLVAT